MIVVIIIAILAAFAIPAFKDMMRRGQITAATQEVLADLTLAKGEAVRRSVNTYLVSSNSDGVTTWQIRAGDPTTGELLQQRQARDSVTITPASASTSNPGNIVFQPRGSAEGGAATIRLSHNDAPDTNRACVTVSWAGNITVSPIDKINADCFTP
ncbi:MAG: GspH/FimT family protein [Betaproteobacteria bacterium]|nr:GspH/FimT family protein [Betaproteobacteria bacterium]